MKAKKVLPVVGMIIAVAALVLMLAYNFRHTGQLLARHVDPEWYAYGAAFGIELGILVLSVAIGTAKWHSLKVGWLWIVLALVLFVSFLANVSEGHLTRYGIDITQDSIKDIDPVQSVIGLAATGMISVIVMAMSEIIGQYVVQLADTREVRDSAAVGTTQVSSNGTGKMEKARQLILEHPDWQGVDIAAAAGCNATTVSKVRKRLREEGLID